MIYFMNYSFSRNSGIFAVLITEVVGHSKIIKKRLKDQILLKT